MQITIIGLGQIGASVGLALEQYKSSMKRVGHDKTPDISRSAQAMGAVDVINFNLPSSVSEADIILLATPLTEMEDTFRYMREDLKEGALVLDTAPVKGKVAEWAMEHIPPGRFYVGLVPSIGPGHLLDVGAGQASARADLFKDAVFLVCPSSKANEQAVKRATSFIELLGATTLFSEPLEADGLMAALHTLPQLLSLGLLNATTTQPGWKEARKMASRPYGLVTSAALSMEEAENIAASVLANKANVSRVLGNMILSLTELQSALDGDDSQSAKNLVEDSHRSGKQWLQDRLGANWNEESQQPAQFPSVGQRLLGTFLKPDKKKK